MDSTTKRTRTDSDERANERDDVRGHFAPLVFGAALAGITAGYLIGTGFEDTRVPLLPVIRHAAGL